MNQNSHYKIECKVNDVAMLDVKTEGFFDIVAKKIAFGWSVEGEDWSIVILAVPGQGGNTSWAVIYASNNSRIDAREGICLWHETAERVGNAIQSVTINDSWIEPLKYIQEEVK